MSDQNERDLEPSLGRDFQELQEALLAEDMSDAGPKTEGEWFPSRKPAAFGASASALVEELMSSHRPAPADARARLISAVDARLEQRRSRFGFLEPLLKASRIAASRTQSAVAHAIDIEVEQLRDLENGLQHFSEADVDLIARWIAELEEDEGEAVAALARSFDATALSSGAYAGRSETPTLSGTEYAEKVRARIVQLRQGGDRSA